jgi:hypothetical protein
VGGVADDYFCHSPLLVFPAQGMALRAAESGPRNLVQRVISAIVNE